MNKRKRFLKLLLNTLIFAGVLFFFSGPITEIISNILKFTTATSQGIVENTSVNTQKVLSSYQLIENQNREIKYLKSRLRKAEYKLNSMKVLANKVAQLDQLLQLQTNRFPKSVSSKVIARSPSSWHKQLIIDKGSNSDFRPGMVVVTPKGILGQIQEVKPNYSIVQLISSSQVKFGASIERTDVLGIIQGDKSGYALLQFVPIGSDVKKGDVVYTTQINPVGVDKLYPFSYPVGKVVSLTRLRNNSEMFIKVKLFEDASTTSEVIVLIPGEDNPPKKLSNTKANNFKGMKKMSSL
ncbi:MAG: rod shape-determining protein MreC [Candidatus Caenarcaniphilales bacterium]|nr:rod shape-determining protein MreC [Candidatus Caenarcaniphilales bacterium]